MLLMCCCRATAAGDADDSDMNVCRWALLHAKFSGTAVIEAAGAGAAPAAAAGVRLTCARLLLLFA